MRAMVDCCCLLMFFADYFRYTRERARLMFVHARELLMPAYFDDDDTLRRRLFIVVARERDVEERCFPCLTIIDDASAITPTDSPTICHYFTANARHAVRYFHYYADVISPDTAAYARHFRHVFIPLLLRHFLRLSFFDYRYVAFIAAFRRPQISVRARAAARMRV